MVITFLKYLQYEKRYSTHTLEAYRRDLTQFLHFLEVTFELGAPAQAGHPHLRSWVVSLVEGGATPRTVNRKIATLKSFYKFLRAREYIAHNPSTGLKPLKTEKKLPGFVREEEIGHLLDGVAFAAGFSGQRDRVLMELLYATGIRLAELIGLRDQDLNFYQQSIKVLGKRNKERIIPISQNLVKLIKEYQQERNAAFPASGYFLLTDKGEQLYPMMVYRTVHKYLNLVTTISKRSPHILRHTFATHLLNKGADLNAVKDLLGHTSLAATQVYTHNSMEKLKAVFDQAHPKA